VSYHKNGGIEYSGQWVDNLMEGSGKLWDEIGNSVHDGNFLGGKVDA
jgi:antitoxin component YwqK of YwqJK toxin-antitoxin module